MRTIAVSSRFRVASGFVLLMICAALLGTAAPRPAAAQSGSDCEDPSVIACIPTSGTATPVGGSGEPGPAPAAAGAAAAPAPAIAVPAIPSQPGPCPVVLPPSP